MGGVSAKYVATYPDGKTETLLSVPDYDFNWQSVYRLAEPLKVPKGTKLTWTGYWDNSADNLRRRVGETGGQAVGFTWEVCLCLQVSRVAVGGGLSSVAVK